MINYRIKDIKMNITSKETFIPYSSRRGYDKYEELPAFIKDLKKWVDELEYWHKTNMVLDVQFSGDYEDTKIYLKTPNEIIYEIDKLEFLED